MFCYYKQIVYLCTVFKINTAPKILKKRELGKFINLKNNNDGKCREGFQWPWQNKESGVYLQEHRACIIKRSSRLCEGISLRCAQRCG